MSAAAGRRLAEVAAQLYRRGWMEGTAGNLSERLESGTALITASGLSKGAMTWRDMVEVRVGDARAVRPDAALPSAETVIHTALYRRFPDCQAVVHAHPPHTTAIAAIAAREGKDAVTFTDLEIIKGLGIPEPGSVTIPVFQNWVDVPRIAEDIEAELTHSAPPALLIGSHGATSWGPTLEIARNRMECLETLCQLTLLIDRR